MRVLTDDVNALVPPPASGSYADWQSTYSRYADFLVALERLSFDFAGLSLNLEKAGLLLPVGAPLPSNEVRAKFPTKFDFQQEGSRVAVVLSVLMPSCKLLSMIKLRRLKVKLFLLKFLASSPLVLLTDY